MAISSLSAGATFEPTMGVWDCNGALDQERYGGPVAVEAGARVIAVVPAARADALMAALRPAVEEGCRDLRVNWVDVLRETGGLTAAHFRIDAAG